MVVIPTPREVKAEESASRLVSGSGAPLRATDRFSYLRKREKGFECINAHPETVALQQEAIPNAAISECTSHFFPIDTLGKSEVDSACCIEGFQLFPGEL